MMLLYLVSAAIALLVFVLTFRVSLRRRIVIALLVFLAMGSAATLAIWTIDDKPAAGDHPYIRWSVAVISALTCPYCMLIWTCDTQIDFYSDQTKPQERALIGAAAGGQINLGLGA